MGYIGYSWSENAQAAKNAGDLTATQAGRLLGVSGSAVAHVLSADSWHHTSAKYNKTNFYDLSQYTTEYFAYSELNDMCDELLRFDARKKAANTEKAVTASIKWTEWSGSWRFPIRHDMKFDGPATVKGDWIHFNGRKKNMKGNHISVTFTEIHSEA